MISWAGGSARSEHSRQPSSSEKPGRSRTSAAACCTANAALSSSPCASRCSGASRGGAEAAVTAGAAPPAAGASSGPSRGSTGRAGGCAESSCASPARRRSSPAPSAPGGWRALSIPLRRREGEEGGLAEVGGTSNSTNPPKHDSASLVFRSTGKRHTAAAPLSSARPHQGRCALSALGAALLPRSPSRPRARRTPGGCAAAGLGAATRR
jgi:hypothetical protein